MAGGPWRWLRKAGIDPAQQPELAVQLASANAIYFALTGQLREALAQRQWARSLEISGVPWTRGSSPST